MLKLEKVSVSRYFGNWSVLKVHFTALHLPVHLNFGWNVDCRVNGTHKNNEVHITLPIIIKKRWIDEWKKIVQLFNRGFIVIGGPLFTFYIQCVADSYIEIQLPQLLLMILKPRQTVANCLALAWNLLSWHTQTLCCWVYILLMNKFSWIKCITILRIKGWLHSTKHWRISSQGAGRYLNHHLLRASGISAQTNWP